MTSGGCSPRKDNAGVKATELEECISRFGGPLRAGLSTASPRPFAQDQRRCGLSVTIPGRGFNHMVVHQRSYFSLTSKHFNQKFFQHRIALIFIEESQIICVFDLSVRLE